LEQFVIIVANQIWCPNTTYLIDSYYVLLCYLH